MQSKPPVKRVVCSEAISLLNRPAPKGAGFHFVQAPVPLSLSLVPKGTPCYQLPLEGVFILLHT